MNPLFYLVTAFSGCLGYLLGDIRGAIIGVTIYFGIAILVNLFVKD